MKRVRIKRIFTTNFNRSARTMYDEMKANRKLWRGALQKDEVYVFVSQTGNQFFNDTATTEIYTRTGTRWAQKRQLLDYRGWRIEGGEFDHRLLENYANNVGLTLGRKTFEEMWAERYPTTGG
jgi:hypothetical protein